MLTGTAKPRFWPAALIAVFIPTTSPRRFTSGPPELPRLIAASVWMKFSNDRVASESPSARPLAETTPTVTVCSMARGLPTAITHSPTRSASESPSGSGVNGPFPSTRISATSVAGSRPTILASIRSVFS